MMQPKEWWRWHFCQKSGSLVLQLDTDFKFVCAIENKQLIPSANSEHAFNLEDVSTYSLLSEALQVLPLSGPERVQIAFNYIANQRFHRPLMPQSWFFHEFNTDYQPQPMELVELYGQFHSNETGLLIEASALFIVIDSNSNASTLMSLEPILELKSGKTLIQFSLIKVMNNRIQAREIQKQWVSQSA